METSEKMRAVVFDMDGLMFDTEAISVKAWDYAGEKLGIGKCGHIAVLLLGTSRELKEQILREEFNGRYCWNDFAVYLKEFRRQYYMTHELPVKKGLYRLLDYLRREHYKMAVASATPQRGVEANLEKAGVRSYFDAVVGGDMIAASKPAPDVYLKACGLLGEEPQRCCALEDSRYGLHAAHRAGCRVFMIPDLWRPDEEVKGFVSGIFADLDSFREYLIFAEKRNRWQGKEKVKMKSAVFYGKHDLRIEESPIPEVGPRDVLIQVKACGVCGTDVHIYEGDQGAADVTPPTILGHEFSGVIVETGAEVKNYKAGDRVCIDPNRYCGACDPCRNGTAHFCEHMIGYGTTVNGGFAEYCAVDERQVYLLGEHTTFEQGAMTEPTACCLHGIDLCGIRPGHQVVVIGGGMIGLLMLQLARLAGAAKTALLEPVENKRRVGKALGADVCIDPIGQDVKAELKKAGFSWVNTVIECVGRTSTMEQAIELADHQAVVMLFGLTRPDDTILLKPFEVFRKELVLKASYINPYTQKRALDLIDSGRLDVSGMVYEVCGLDRLEAVLSDPALRAKGKFIISPEK